MILYIKPEYKMVVAQDDLRHDSITLLAMNMSSNSKMLEGKALSRKEIKKCVDLFKDVLYSENNIFDRDIIS